MKSSTVRRPLAAAVIAASALTLAVAPPATAGPRHVFGADVALAADVQTVSTGPLMGVLSALGVDTIPIAYGSLRLNLVLDWTNSSAPDVYNALNALPLNEPTGYICGLSTTPQCRVTPVIASGLGAFGARDAINAMWSAASGNGLLPSYGPLAGLEYYRPGGYYVPSAQTTTDAVSIFFNNPLRPNGGIAARFAPLLSLFGVDAGFPQTGTQTYQPAGFDPNKLVMVSNVVDVTWAYNPMADFPVTLNPFALLNSLMAVIPPAVLFSTPITQLFDQFNDTFGIDGSTLPPRVRPTQPAPAPALRTANQFQGTDFALDLGAFFAGSPDLGLLVGAPPGVKYELFGTLRNDQLPLLMPLRLPATVINAALKAIGSPVLVGTPVADILQPALTILVNIGYPDVVTPTDLVTNPDLAALGYRAYDRTFAQTPITFGSVRPLTPRERLRIPGDVLNALATGLVTQVRKPFFGIVVPNTAAAASRQTRRATTPDRTADSKARLVNTRPIRAARVR